MFSSFFLLKHYLSNKKNFDHNQILDLQTKEFKHAFSVLKSPLKTIADQIYFDSLLLIQLRKYSDAINALNSILADPHASMEMKAGCYFGMALSVYLEKPESFQENVTQLLRQAQNANLEANINRFSQLNNV